MRLLRNFLDAHVPDIEKARQKHAQLEYALLTLSHLLVRDQSSNKHENILTRTRDILTTRKIGIRCSPVLPFAPDARTPCDYISNVGIRIP